ncbi:MAG: TIGR04282 family arsenosugar biosynthesis glycosyltransferase, partial [Gemmatimonadales bacterium]
PGDLGVRLAAAARAVPSGAAWICVGGDCPNLSTEHLQLAVAALDDHDVVLGPTMDGGYYLLGGKLPLPDLFTAMPWSTDRLLAATRRRLTHLGASWTELPILRDVDTAADARAAGLLV